MTLHEQVPFKAPAYLLHLALIVRFWCILPSPYWGRGTAGQGGCCWPRHSSQSDRQNLVTRWSSRSSHGPSLSPSLCLMDEHRHTSCSPTSWRFSLFTKMLLCVCKIIFASHNYFLLRTLFLLLVTLFQLVACSIMHVGVLTRFRISTFACPRCWGSLLSRQHELCGQAASEVYGGCCTSPCLAQPMSQVTSYIITS